MIPDHHVFSLSFVRRAFVDARFGPGRSFCCASTRSTRAVVSSWFSSTTPTRSAATWRSASKRAASIVSFIRRGQCAEAPSSTTRPHTSLWSPTLTRLPLHCNGPSTEPAISAFFVSVQTLRCADCKMIVTTTKYYVASFQYSSI